MNLTLPIYVEGTKPGVGGTIYRARPLFFAQPEVKGDQLDRLMTRLTRDLGQLLTRLGRQARHEELTSYTFNPPLSQQRLELILLLRRRTFRCRYLFLVFRQLGRRLAFTPSLPEVWFDLVRGETLRDRATEVLTRHFRELECDDAEIDPAAQQRRRELAQPPGRDGERRVHRQRALVPLPGAVVELRLLVLLADAERRHRVLREDR